MHHTFCKYNILSLPLNASPLAATPSVQMAGSAPKTECILGPKSHLIGNAIQQIRISVTDGNNIICNPPLANFMQIYTRNYLLAVDETSLVYLQVEIGVCKSKSFSTQIDFFI